MKKQYNQSQVRLGFYLLNLGYTKEMIQQVLANPAKYGYKLAA